jgi:putative inorganic carbon (hco3(-)) transporter
VLYLVVLVYIAAAYVRPGEVISGLAAYPVIDVLSGLALALAAGSLALDFRPFWREPLDKAVLLYALIIVLSNPAWGYFQGGQEAFFKFLPVLVCYFLIRIAVRTRRQLSGIATLFVYLNVFLAVNGILQAYTGLGFGGVEIMDTREGARIRGTGIFNDPNDLGMTLVMSVPFLLATILEPQRGFFRRVLSTAWFGTIVFACYLTNSRGTMLGLGAVMLTYAYRRLRDAAGIADPRRGVWKVHRVPRACRA